MRLLHPFMPFLTEEIWQQLPKPSGAPGSIMITLYPIADDELRDLAVEKQMELVMDVTVALRNLRAEYNIPGAQPVTAHVRISDPERREMLRQQTSLVERLTRFTLLVQSPEDGVPAGFSAKAVVGGDAEVVVPLASVVDVGAEKARLGKDIAKTRKDVDGLERKLGNQAFVAKAPAEVVEKDRARLAEEKAKLAKLEAALAALGA
jgi:valyl-tRNA synthetase